MKKKSAEIPHFHNDTIFYACPYCLPDREARLKESKNLKASCDHKKGIFDKDKETFFKYNPIKKFKKTSTKKISNENPFKILENLKLG